jgi:hypothetical protein
MSHEQDKDETSYLWCGGYYCTLLRTYLRIYYIVCSIRSATGIFITCFTVVVAGFSKYLLVASSSSSSRSRIINTQTLTLKKKFLQSSKNFFFSVSVCV